jgi:hypothetical protein
MRRQATRGVTWWPSPTRSSSNERPFRSVTDGNCLLDGKHPPGSKYATERQLPHREGHSEAAGRLCVRRPTRPDEHNSPAHEGTQAAPAPNYERNTLSEQGIRVVKSVDRRSPRREFRGSGHVILAGKCSCGGVATKFGGSENRKSLARPPVFTAVLLVAPCSTKRDALTLARLARSGDLANIGERPVKTEANTDAEPLEEHDGHGGRHPPPPSQT